jgi:cytochrome b561
MLIKARVIAPFQCSFDDPPVGVRAGGRHGGGRSRYPPMRGSAGPSGVIDMSVSSSGASYGRVAKLLHWLVALLIAAQFVIGWTMPHVGRTTLPVGLVGAHVTVGVLIVLFVLFRIVWRIFNRPPEHSGVTANVRRLAAAGHGMLYLLMIVIPLLGWANANARGWVVGLTEMFSPSGELPDIRLPSIMEKGSALGHDLGDVHGDLAWVLLVVIGLHVAVGLYHHIVLKDGLLNRMR